MSSRRNRNNKHNQEADQVEVEDDSQQEEEQLSTPQELLDACREIRAVWLAIGEDEDDDEKSLRKSLQVVEQRYRNILRVAKDCLEVASSTMKTNISNNNDSDDVTYHCVIHECRTKLALLYIQRGNEQDAKTLLHRMGCLARLSDEVLRYKVPVDDDDDKEIQKQQDQKQPEKSKNNNTNNNNSSSSAAAKDEGCCFVDNLVSQPVLQKLQQTFCSENANYWKAHNYSVDPPSPYFSYLADLKTDGARENNTVLSELLRAAQRAVSLKFPRVGTEANFVEIWGHTRSHSSNHQLHYDAVSEVDCPGQTLDDGIKHPLATCVFVISKDTRCGGPTLITNQKLGDVKMADKGWLCFPNPNRLFFFESSFLHGVIPGSMDDLIEQKTKQNKMASSSPPRRVTLMLAFWKKIEIRRSEKSGAARPLPSGEDENDEEWIKLLRSKVNSSSNNSNKNTPPHHPHPAPVLQNPAPLSHVWVDVKNNKPWPKDAPIVAYEEAFQY